jgi:hypothetical protein
MTELLPAYPSPLCQADHDCERAPCFQARLEAVAGRRWIRTRTELCAQHLGGTVQALTTWARNQGLKGEVTVLAIDLPAAGRATSAWSGSGLAFGSIPVTA